MTENRNEKLLNEALRYIAAHTPARRRTGFCTTKLVSPTRS